MFGRKKKKEEEKPRYYHPVLGEMRVDSEVCAVEPYHVTLFGKQYSGYLYINAAAYSKTNAFSAPQEAAIDFLKNNPDQVRSCLERQLRSFLGIDHPNVFQEKLELETITISSGGELGVMFNSEFSDEDLAGVDSGCCFTDSFGVVIYPEERILYNEQACYVFDS